MAPAGKSGTGQYKLVTLFTRGNELTVARHSRRAGIVLKLLVLEAVQHGCSSAKAVRDYLAKKGVDLPLSTVYYHLRQLVKMGALSHSYAVYSVTPRAGDIYRGLMRLVISEFQTRGVGGRRACARNNTIILKYYGSSGSTRRRKGIIVVPGFTVVEGNETCLRLWYPSVVEALGGIVRAGRVSRVMVYVDERNFVHVDVAASKVEQERFLNGYWGDRFASVVTALYALALEVRQLWGAKVLNEVMRAVERSALLLTEPPTLDAWVEGNGAGDSVVVGPPALRGK